MSSFTVGVVYDGSARFLPFTEVLQNDAGRIKLYWDHSVIGNRAPAVSTPTPKSRMLPLGPTKPSFPSHKLGSNTVPAMTGGEASQSFNSPTILRKRGGVWLLKMSFGKLHPFSRPEDYPQTFLTIFDSGAPFTWCFGIADDNNLLMVKPNPDPPKSAATEGSDRYIISPNIFNHKRRSHSCVPKQYWNKEGTFVSSHDPPDLNVFIAEYVSETAAIGNLWETTAWIYPLHGSEPNELVPVEQCEISLAVGASKILIEDRADAVLGLSMTKGRRLKNKKPFLETAYATGVIDAKSFSFELYRARKMSWFRFGAADPNHVHACSTWFSLVASSWISWSISFSHLQTQSATLDISKILAMGVALDTRADFCYFPVAFLDELYSELPKPAPPSSPTGAPYIRKLLYNPSHNIWTKSFKLLGPNESESIAIPYSYLIYENIDAMSDLGRDDALEVHGIFQAPGVHSDHVGYVTEGFGAMIGMRLMSRFRMIFDGERSRIGFGRKTESSI